MGFHWELATMATPVTLPLLKLMKQDATACLHPCGNPNQMAEIRIGCVLSSILSQPKKKLHFRCQYSASDLSDILSLDSRNSISTVKHSFSLHCTVSGGSFVYCTDQQHWI